MGFRPLLDEWRDSRQERAPMPVGERCASIENDLGDSMKLGQFRWLEVFCGWDRDHEQEREISG